MSFLDVFLLSIIKALDVAAWSPRNLCSAHNSVRHYMELTDNRFFHRQPRKMVPKHDEMIPKELDSLFS